MLEDTILQEKVRIRPMMIRKFQVDQKQQRIEGGDHAIEEPAAGAFTEKVRNWQVGIRKFEADLQQSTIRQRDEDIRGLRAELDKERVRTLPIRTRELQVDQKQRAHDNFRAMVDLKDRAELASKRENQEVPELEAELAEVRQQNCKLQDEAKESDSELERMIWTIGRLRERVTDGEGMSEKIRQLKAELAAMKAEATATEAEATATNDEKHHD